MSTSTYEDTAVVGAETPALMKAAVVHSFTEPLRFEEVETPASEGSGSALEFAEISVMCGGSLAKVGALGADSTGTVSPMPFPTIIERAFGTTSISTTCRPCLIFMSELVSNGSSAVMRTRRTR